MAAGDDPAARRKLCGFFRAVVSADPSSTLTPGSRVPLLEPSLLAPLADSAESTPSKGHGRRRRGGTVDSVLRLVRALVRANCVEAEATLLRVKTRVVGEEKEVRAVVLVDLYLPTAAWSGWQFPKSRAAAAGSLISHLSSDWEERKSLLAFDWNNDDLVHEDDQYIWSYSDCHVLHCEAHSTASVVSNEKLFDLHEIFKTLPSVGREKKKHWAKLLPDKAPTDTGIWDLSYDVLMIVLAHLGPIDLVRVAATCHLLRSVAASVMPFMKLKLFPHQEAAVEWMMKRELSSGILRHPLWKELYTEDGFSLYANVVNGELSIGSAPTINDFHGGLFCDEPGLGKTVTALSLILKTRGTLAEPPPDVEVTWYMHKLDQKCGYYELSSCSSKSGALSTLKRLIRKKMPRGEILYSYESPPGRISVGKLAESSKRGKLNYSGTSTEAVNSDRKATMTDDRDASTITSARLRCTRSMGSVKCNLDDIFDEGSSTGRKRKRKSDAVDSSNTQNSELNDTWVQCDSCRKWRRLSERGSLNVRAAWFCSMHSDPMLQSCAAPEESWDLKGKITNLPGFYAKGSSSGGEPNVAFFIGVLKDNIALFNSETKMALTWLANLSPRKLLEMETNGLIRPVLDARSIPFKDGNGYHKIFQAFGLRKKLEKGVIRWHYPRDLDNLIFDSTALKIALTKRLDSFRFYLSRATLIVVPSNLVDHWKTQIERHVLPGQLRVYIWGDHRGKLSAHSLAWDYDIVITTFSRLSAEWFLDKRSILMQVHWLRLMLDEGHTLGSSFSLTNKVQMAVSLVASNRWILTGTPTPHTPTSQVSHLRLMLEFLHDEAYGQNQESWDAGIQKPFEAQMGEGRQRLMELLQRTLISARKSDLTSIPPCLRKVVFLHFNEGHARSYNELVATVRRNILMADWNDPSHVESLLNPKQWKFRSTTIKNVRLSCCVAGHIKVTDAGEDIQETMDFLVQQRSLKPSSEDYTVIRAALLNGCNCSRCGDWCRLPVITPCMHLLCLECVALDSEKCTYPNCGNHYEMQSPATSARPENPNPKWPVPKDLIELQPSYKQDDWDPDWQSTSSSKVAYLVERLKQLQKVNLKLENNHAYPTGGSIVKSCSTLPEKVIVFSQFLEHIHVIEQQLTIAGVSFAGMYNPMPLGRKKKALATFQLDPHCMVLLMDGSAALGLDLSFVTHVFLMEPIWDRSMEEQVVSRAHRMGATRPIYVETLAMRGTIEEQMLEVLQDPDSCGRLAQQDLGSPGDDGSRAHRSLHDFAGSSYLAQLSFVQTRANA